MEVAMPASPDPSDITILLQRWNRGDADAYDQLVASVQSSLVPPIQMPLTACAAPTPRQVLASSTASERRSVRLHPPRVG